MSKLFDYIEIFEKLAQNKYYEKYKQDPLFISKIKEKAKKIREEKESGNLTGLIIELTQRIATQKGSLIDRVNGRVKDILSDPSKHHLFKSHIDKINLARQNNDQEQEILSKKELTKTLKEYAKQDPRVIAYDFIADNFRKFRDEASIIDKSNILNLPIEYNSKEYLFIIKTINHGKNLIQETFENQKDKWGDVNREVKTFKNILSIVEQIIDYLSQRIK